MISRSLVLFVTLVAAQSCVVDVGAPTDAHIRVVTDISRTDTINAEPSSQMVIQVLGPKGRLDHDVSVSLSGLPSPIEGQDLTMHPLDVDYGGVPGRTTQTTSDRVSFRVRFGNRAGPAGLLISVPELNLVDTLSFTVKPGAPAFIRLKPGDTAIIVGQSYTQDGLVLDQGGDDLGLRPVFSSADPALTVAASGMVDGATIGRAGVSVSYAVGGALIRETAMVSVVPGGQIALGVSAPGATATSAIGIRRTDGTTVKTYPTPQSPFETTWSADGLRVYYAGEAASGSQRLYSLTLSDGSIQTIVPDADPALNGRRLVWPAPSRDGAWVYFIVLESGPWSSVWRVHPDGTGVAELVGDAPPVGDFRIRNSPSPSPDGTRLAYTEKSASANDVKVLDLTSGVVTTITGTGADEVRWSPTGERLATRGGAGLYVVNPDGSGLRQVMSDISVFGGLGWSGDGHWILVNVQTAPNIVDPDTGLFLPVPLAGAGLAWNPK